MDRTYYFIGIAFFGMINGLFNQLWLLFALIYTQQLAGPLFFGSVSLTLMFASLMVSTATIILGGIPAAIYERVKGIEGRFHRGLAVDLARRHGHPDPAGRRQFPEDRPLISRQQAAHGIVNVACKARDRSQIGALGGSLTLIDLQRDHCLGRHASHRLRDGPAGLRVRLADHLLHHGRPVVQSAGRVPVRRRADHADDGHPGAEGLRGAHQALPPHRDVALSAQGAAPAGGNRAASSPRP